MNEAKAREIAIQVLEEFEELLAVKGIKIPSDDHEGREEEAREYCRAQGAMKTHFAASA